MVSGEQLKRNGATRNIAHCHAETAVVGRFYYLPERLVSIMIAGASSDKNFLPIVQEMGR